MEGKDYDQVFSPVARSGSIRTMLSLTAGISSMLMTQFDVKTAFLNGELEEEIYMRQPEGFDDGTGRVCRLHKSIYGLKQSSRQWNKKFHSFLDRYGLKRSAADHCI